MQVSVRVVESTNRLVYFQPIGENLSGFAPQEGAKLAPQSGPSNRAVRCAKKVGASAPSEMKATPKKSKPLQKGQPRPQLVRCEYDCQRSVQRQRVRKPKSR